MEAISVQKHVDYTSGSCILPTLTTWWQFCLWLTGCLLVGLRLHTYTHSHYKRISLVCNDKVAAISSLTLGLQRVVLGLGSFHVCLQSKGKWMQPYTYTPLKDCIILHLYISMVWDHWEVGSGTRLSTLSSARRRGEQYRSQGAATWRIEQCLRSTARLHRFSFLRSHYRITSSHRKGHRSMFITLLRDCNVFARATEGLDLTDRGVSWRNFIILFSLMLLFSD